MSHNQQNEHPGRNPEVAALSSQYPPDQQGLNQAMQTPILELVERRARDAINELRWLRKENEIMRAKISVFDDVMQLFRARAPEQGMAYQPDAAVDLENILRRALEEQHQEPRRKNPSPGVL